MDPIKKLRELLAELRTKRDELRAERQKITDAVEARPEAERDLTPEEAPEYRRLSRELAEVNDEIVEANDRLAELLAEDAAERAAADALRGIDGGTPRVDVRSEPMTYERHNRENSFFRDLALATVHRDAQASERLSRHAQEVAVERRDISRTDGAGGEFVPPLWLVDEYAALARAGRVTANLCRQLPLPAGTDSINIPRVTTGTAVAAQTADNAAVQETDIVTTSVAAPVVTIAGQQDAALQLVEQSPLAGGLDALIFMDLEADYNSKLDVQVLSGSGSSGQVRGILNTSGIGSVTYTDASPTVPELYAPVAQALSSVSGNRILPPEAIVMHPRRWFWGVAALDSNNRPLFVPAVAGPNNALATPGDVQAEGPVGTMQGLPVYIDPNVPTTLGSGTNEDRIIVARFSDNLLMEGELRTRVLPEVLSGTLTVRFQLYRYVAFTAGRYPAASAVVSGTGLVAPSGF